MKTILYDDFDLMTEEEVRAEWEDFDDDEIYDFIEQAKRDELDDFIEEFKWYLDRYTFIAIGTLGLWSGQVEAGMIINSINDFDKLIEDTDDIRIIDNEGHLIVEAYHHDGCNKFELRKLNDEGMKYYEGNGYKLSDKELLQKLFTSKYSNLPHYAKYLYGC